MSNLFTDNFTRADNTALGANWNEFSANPAGGWQILTNRLRGPTTDQPANAHVCETTVSALAVVADCLVTVTRVAGTNFDGGPMLRKASGASTYYYVDFSGTNTWQVYRVVAGVSTAVGSAITSAGANGDTMGLSASGTTIKVFKNGAQIGINLTDSNISAAGFCGVVLWSGSGDVDDFTVDDLGVAATTTDLGYFPAARNNQVGPAALRFARRSAVPLDLTLAPITDTNFSTRVDLPHNRVGPMALRRLFRSPAYPFDSTVSTGTSTNRLRRVICAGA